MTAEEYMPLGLTREELHLVDMPKEVAEEISAYWRLRDIVETVDRLEPEEKPSVDLKANFIAVLGGSTLESLGWQDRALCAQTDPEAFFPETGGSTREAKKVCSSCEVRIECLDYALAHDERFGVWGGLSERERRKLKRRAV